MIRTVIGSGSYRVFLAMLMVAAIAGLAASPAQAVVYTWSGGNGTWDASSLNWNTGAVAWPNTNPNADTAAFSDNTVTIAAATTIYVNTITVSANTLDLSGGDADSVLAFSGTGASVQRKAVTFSNIKVDTGSGVTFSLEGQTATFANTATLQGTGRVNLRNDYANNYGAGPNHQRRSVQLLGRVLGSQLNAPRVLAYGIGGQFSGYGRFLGYGQFAYSLHLGAQTPVGVEAAGVTASNGGIIELAGT